MTHANDCTYPADNKTHTEGGLTKREYFAAMAMQGLIANTDFSNISNNENVSRWSIAYADALINELNKKQ